MYKCLFCGLENSSEKARFCVECGPDGLSKNWTLEDIDQPQKVAQYVSMLSEFYFDAQTGAAVEKFSLRIRERLKISYDTHASVLSKLSEQKKATAHLANFRFEFNENVVDAYAGHDTFLSFRYTNLSEDDLFKVSLLWDDPDTERIDFRAETKSLVKPMNSVTVSSSAIFDRIGTKELSDFQITITDQFGESAKFRVEPFVFKVGNHDQKITQNISTHNQISIEGRGVVDASGMGAEKSVTQSEKINPPRWRELSFSYIPEVMEKSALSQNENPASGVEEKPETLTNTKTELVKFDKENLLSVLQAAEQGDSEAQTTLGNMYLHGQGVAKNDEQAVHWLRKAANQGCAVGQNNLGIMYDHGKGVAKNDDQALYWYRKAAEQGNMQGQYNLGAMYYHGQGVAKNDEQAMKWYRKAAAQGDADAIEALKNIESAKASPQPPTDGYGSWVYDNCSYTGMFKNGTWHGLGELIWSGDFLGHRYVGNFVNGRRHGQGTYTFPNGANQVGTFENDVYQEPQIDEEDEEDEGDGGDGEDCLVYNDGSRYEGGVKDGEPEGFGTMTFANGDSVYGIFVCGLMNDETAHYDFADGGTYDGPMVDGKFCGHGERTFGGDFVGHSYTGNFENGYFNGEGIYSFPDGSQNVGQFKDGKFVPPSSGGQDYVYIGPTSNGLPHGVGKMTLKSGEIYTGDFVNGLRHGLGELTYANGEKVNGRFENNDFVKNASFTENLKIGYKVGRFNVNP